MSFKRSIWLLMVTISMVGLVSAQTDSCPAIVQAALEAVGDACRDIGRNEICYGNNSLTALDFLDAPVEALSDVGDSTEIFDIASIATTPFDLNSSTWGVAILVLQADLPDTLPGQNVTFVVFGDTEIVNDVVPEAQRVDSLSATSTGGINLRSGAGTNFDIVGTLAFNEAVSIIGRNASGDWVQIEFEDSSAWVFASLLTIDGNPTLLNVVGDSENSDYSATMQAFSLSTGIGQAACSEVPPDGVLIQAPTDTTVHFLINGIEVEIGSTVFVQYIGGVLVVTNLEGSVTVTNSGVTQVIEPGYSVFVSVAGEPGAPVEFAYDDFAALPLILLPEPIGIPVLVRSDNTWQTTGIAVEAGDTFTLLTGGIVNFWDNCDAEKVAMGQPDIDCDSLIFDPAGGDPVNMNGEILGSVMSFFPVPSAPPHSLVGRIGSSTFFVGNGGDFIAETSGTLEFRTNDIDLNNSGAYFVSVVLP